MIIYLKAGRGVLLALKKGINVNRSLRIQTGEDQKGKWVKFKIGEGQWTAPIYSDDDPNQ